MAYQQYLNTLEFGPIAHLDRIKFTLDKTKVTMHSEWFNAYGVLQLDKESKRKPPLKYIWNQKIRELKGTRLTICRRWITIEIHNILNRYPDVEVLNIYKMCLELLRKHNVLLDSLENLLEITSVSEIEVRWDFHRKQNLYEYLKPLAVTIERDPGAKKGTIYFTKESSNCRFRLYEKGAHTRFEVVLKGKTLSVLQGNSKEIINNLFIKSSLRTRPALYSRMFPRIRSPAYFQDFDFDFEELFKLSQLRDKRKQLI